MELLVAALHATQDSHGLLLARLANIHRLETTRQGPVLLHVLAVLAHRGGTDASDLATRQRRFEDVRCIQGAFGRAGADERVNLVDEDDHLRVALEFLEKPLQALLELSAILGPRHQERQVEGEDAAIGEEHRHGALDQAGCQSLDDGGLPNPRLTQKQWVVLCPPAENLHHPLDLLLAADERIETAFLGEQGEIARVLADIGRGLGGRLLLELASEAHDPLPQLEELEAAGGQVLGGVATLDPEQPQEQVLGADAGVAHALRFVHGVGEDLLRLLGQRQVGRGADLVEGHAIPEKLLAQLTDVDAGPVEEPGQNGIGLSQYTEQEVLRANRVTARATRLVTGEEQTAAHVLVESFKHFRNYRPPARDGKRRRTCGLSLRCGSL